MRRKRGPQSPTSQTREKKGAGWGRGRSRWPVEKNYRPAPTTRDRRKTVCTEVRAQSSPGRRRATETWTPGATKTVDHCCSPTLAVPGTPWKARRTMARNARAAGQSSWAAPATSAWQVSREPNSLCSATQPRGSRNPSGRRRRAGRSGGCVDQSQEHAAAHSAAAGTASWSRHPRGRGICAGGPRPPCLVVQ